MRSSLRCKLLFGIVLLFLAGLASAQDQYGAQGQYADPPSRVARLQAIRGQVSMQPGGVDDWIDAGLNRPLTTGDRLWADRDSRAELTIGSAAFRVGSESSLTLTNLSDSTAQIELDQGTLSLWVRYLNRGEIVEVDTPNIAFTVTQPGEYRLDVSPQEDRTWVQVRRGEGEANGQEGALVVPRGELYVFSNGQSGEYAVAEASPRDEFESWSAERERRVTASNSARYVAPGTIGYEALDDGGDWQPYPTYGTVWFPRVHAGWAPYHEGHWAWIEPWGYTWVDDAPWGFAPFHYGRWVFVEDRWGWIPGPREVRPVYAPALVAWIGGPSFGVSIGIGVGVGWVPLGWHDPFIPSYHVSVEYARQVNISNSRVVNTTIINNYYSTTNVNVRNTTINNVHFENVQVRGAVTAVPAAALTSGRPVAQAAVVVSPQATAKLNFAAVANVAPSKQAVLGGHAPAAAPAALVVPKQVVAKTPPPPPPVSFEKQRPMLEKSNGMPLPPQQRATLQATSPAPAAHARPAIVTAPKAAPKAAGAPGAPPALRGGAAAAPPPHAAGTPPAPAPGATPPAGAPTGRPAPSARPVTPPAAAPAERPAPTARPATPEGGPAERPAPSARPVTPPAGAPAERPAPSARPVTPPAGAPAERPAPSARPVTPPAGAPAERPAPSARPATPPEGRPAPSARPAMPEGGPAERPAPSARPATPPSERVERPAPSPRATPQAERPAERPAPPSARPATPPPSKEAAPSQEKKAPPKKEKEKEKENQSNVPPSER